MGPRSDERGNVVELHCPDCGEVASMGPRSDERGNSGAARPWRRDWAGFNGAAL
jgi:hypothetical protein